MPRGGSLVGDESDESKSDQLSALWKDSVPRPLEREAISNTRGNQVSPMWFSETAQRWSAKNVSRKGPTVHVPKLLVSILKAVESEVHTPPFFYD